MIMELVKQWDKNKHKLEEYFRTTNQDSYSQSYSSIVEKLFQLCFSESNFDVSKMTVIDDGDYQGTQIFIIPKDTYQPNVEDYVVTDTYYGSCSGCDTLQSISEYDGGLPNEEQVSEYMTLALHLVQKLKWLSNEDQENEV